MAHNRTIDFFVDLMYSMMSMFRTGNSVAVVCFWLTCVIFVWTGVRRERSSYRGARHRRNPQSRDSSGGALGVRGRSQHHLEFPLNPPHPLFPSVGGAEENGLNLSAEQLVKCILEAEPPQIYLREQVKKPYTEASMMMSLTNLADKELVLMISWAKKIPGVEKRVKQNIDVLLSWQRNTEFYYFITLMWSFL